MLGSRGLPFAWLLRGSLEERLIGPWREKLEKKKCNIKTSIAVTAVEVDDEGMQLTLGRASRRRTPMSCLRCPLPNWQSS